MAIEGFIARYGVAAVFAGAAIEGETAVVLGGILAHRGLLDPFAAAGAAALGSFMADETLFALGRRLRDRGPVRRLRARPAFARAVRAVERRPRLFIFAFRFAYGLRTVSPVAIGTTAVPTARFAGINLVSAIVWASLFTTIGYAFGEALEAAFGYLRGERLLLIGGAAALVAGIAVALVWRRRRARVRRPVGEGGDG